MESLKLRKLTNLSTKSDSLSDYKIYMENKIEKKLNSQFIQNEKSNYFTTGFILIGYTLILQILLHSITFLLNSLAYHYLDTFCLGLVNVRLGLFYSTLIFISREAFRRACLSRGGELINAEINYYHDQKSSSPLPSSSSTSSSSLSVDSNVIRKIFHGNDQKQNMKDDKNHKMKRERWANLINLVWLVLPLGMIISLILGIVWLYILPSPSNMKAELIQNKLSKSVIEHQYFVCVIVYIISGLFELATEPFWLICQIDHIVRARIFIEALANSMRALGIISCIFYNSPNYAIYSLALPQILHGSTLLISYLIYFRFVISNSTHTRYLERISGIDSMRDLFPNYFQYSIDQPGLKLVRNFFGQGLLKQFLTEGERYLISAFHLISFSDQGIYDLVSNLGSTAARLLFLPIEESCHFIFGQCLQRNIPPHSQDKNLLMEVFRMFRAALRISSLVAWIGVIFAQANSCLLLTIYAGPKLGQNSTAINLLKFYSFYVLLLAWNGSTEALLNAAMSTDDVLRHNKRLIGFSLLFLAANWLFVSYLNVYGFVLANCINMIARISYSIFYINKFMDNLTNSLGEQESIRPNRLGENSLEVNEQEFNSTSKAIAKFSLLLLLLPNWSQSIILAISLVGTLVSEYWFCCTQGFLWMGLHAICSTVFLAGVMIVIYMSETELIKLVRTGIFSRKKE